MCDSYMLNQGIYNLGCESENFLRKIFRFLPFFRQFAENSGNDFTGNSYHYKPSTTCKLSEDSLLNEWPWKSPENSASLSSWIRRHPVFVSLKLIFWIIFWLRCPVVFCISFYAELPQCCIIWTKLIKGLTVDWPKLRAIYWTMQLHVYPSR